MRVDFWPRQSFGESLDIEKCRSARNKVSQRAPKFKKLFQLRDGNFLYMGAWVGG